MDPDLVRLILIVFGVLLVVGIYLWDRYKHAMPHKRMARDVARGDDYQGGEEFARGSRAEPTLDDDDVDDYSDYDDDPDEVLGLKPKQQPPVASAKDEPETVISRLAQAEMPLGNESRPQTAAQPQPEPQQKPATQAEPEKPKAAPRNPNKRAASTLDPDPVDVGDWSASRNDDPQFSMDLNFDAHGDNDYLHTDPALADEVERKIVVINLKAKNGSFSGSAIERACQQNGMQIGDMSIYHRYDGNSDRVMFSMASMVEPGTFPADDMANFSTPGLSMFTQLPGVRDGVEIYEAMLATANSLAALMQGELQDERHNKLTRQMQEHTRESIIEHRRKIKLARSRH